MKRFFLKTNIVNLFLVSALFLQLWEMAEVKNLPTKKSYLRFHFQLVQRTAGNWSAMKCQQREER